jgi:hypothetical protein
MTVSDLLDRLARPEYTGRDRCLPCTVVNLAIVGLAAVLLGRKRRALGLLAAAVGVTLVALRGYVVPGTPRFAPRLVAPLPFDFGHADERRDSLSGSGEDESRSDPDDTPDALAADADPEAVLSELVAAGVIDSDGEELLLDDSFRADWTDRIESLRDADDEAFLYRVVAATPSATGGETVHDRVFLDGDRETQTSRAIATAEAAAVETLEEWGLAEQYRAPAATPLRTFLDTCPSCGGRIVETTVRNCCGGPGGIRADPEQPVLACEDCDTVLVDL